MTSFTHSITVFLIYFFRLTQTAVELLTQGIIYVRLGRLAFAEQILLRSLGIFVIIQELDSAHELFLLQCIHFLAITLELSGDEDKFIYAK